VIGLQSIIVYLFLFLCYLFLINYRNHSDTKFWTENRSSFAMRVAGEVCRLVNTLYAKHSTGKQPDQPVTGFKEAKVLASYSRVAELEDKTIHEILNVEPKEEKAKIVDERYLVKPEDFYESDTSDDEDNE
jgi:hypothetical protein